MLECEGVSGLALNCMQACCLLLAELGGRAKAASFLQSTALQPGGTSADTVIDLNTALQKL